MLTGYVNDIVEHLSDGGQRRPPDFRECKLRSSDWYKREMGPNGVEKSFEWLCLFCKCVIKRS
jgi:hypothetical protein